MDPKASKPKRQDPDQVSSRRPNRLLLSETVPPSSHQPQESQNRSHNLSDRIHEYYEKLVKNSQMKKTFPPSQSHQFSTSTLHQRFGDPYLVDRSSVTVPRYGEQLSQPISIHTALQPANNVRQPYTVYVEDPTAAFQRYSKRKPSPANRTGSAYLETSDKSDACAPDTASTRLLRERSKSPLMNRTQCALCHSSSHSSQNCSVQSRVPAEHDGFFCDPVYSGGSPPARHPKAGDENEGDGSQDRKATTSFSKKRSIPANINVRCERDVIGQEKSPVSKSHPVGSAALSTSSSNGDTVPRERKKWVRPPLVGQAASSTEKSPFMNFDCLDDHSHSLEKTKTSNDGLQLSSSTGSDQTDTQFSHPKSSYFNPSNNASHNNEDFYEAADRDVVACQQLTSESDSCAGGRISPSSSVTSNRRLEWDSGADVGYNHMYSSPNPGVSSLGLCTIERMALAQGCSVALHLRLDPEGTTVPATPGTGLAPAVLPSLQQDKPTPCPMGKPAAESTPVDQLPFIARALTRYHNDPKSVISPIYHINKKDCAEPQGFSGPLHEENEEEEEEAKEENQGSLSIQKSKSPDGQGSSASTIPFHRQLSNSMQDLRNCSNKLPENQLLKSQSDPDLSGDTPTVISKAVQSKLLKGISGARNFVESQVTGHSISSGSDATLVHVGTEEDLAVDEDNDSTEQPVTPKSTKLQDEVKLSVPQELVSVSMPVSETGKVSAQAEQENLCKSSRPQPVLEKKEEAPAQLKENKPRSNTHVCSDSDHKRGLHHHFGVLCSTVLGGHIQSSTQASVGAQLENVVQGPDRVYSANENQNKQQSRESTQSPTQESEIFTGESTGSSAFHSDAAHEVAPCTSTLTGRANSFEYLPGHVYEKNSASNLRKHEKPPGISTSTETDSEPVRPMSRMMHRKVVESSSHDTEDENDRLWGSPRAGSNTLVHDLERGVHLLKGVMENKSAGRRCKRELIRRIIKKLVTSEYVEDMIEKERVRHQARSPFSPRKIKYQERQEKNLRSKRPVGHERREISGESDEPKQRVNNVRRKLPTHQPVHHPQGPRTLSTLASGSKSSSLWSSHADSTSGSISLSGSSDTQNKESKTSVKPNRPHEPHEEETVDWLKPATQSEKLFEMRKSGATQAEKHLAGLLGMHGQEPTTDPMLFKNDPQKQLSWVNNEINHLKILKQLLQKQEYLERSLDPNLCQTNLTTMPVTRLKQTMQMADCTSPDVPESQSPSLKPSRRQQWISLESDTSAGFGLSNNTGSSRDSHWQEVEVASAGEQEGHPHRTVSISDADQTTDASCSLSNRKSDASHSSGPQIAQKPRRRSVSISDTDQQLGLPPASDTPFQKKRSDCQCGKPDSRVYSAKPVQIGTYGPPPRNLVSENSTKQVCENCTAHSQLTKREAPASAGVLRSSLTTHIGGCLVMPRSDTSGQPSEDRAKKPQPCSCGPARVQAKNCCCSSTQSAGPSSAQSTGVVKNRNSGSSHQLVSRVVAEVPATSTQPLSGGGLVRVHIETDRNLDSSCDRSESLKNSMGRDRGIADVSSIARQGSDDSITKAVTDAVSSKVKALRNLGQIEEAEVKIRVKVAPGQVADSVTSHSERGRVLKTQDLEDESTYYPSKHSEMEEMIARQRAMDIETRQKLLAIAESRQRAQMSLNDVDRRIQDILLQDYLSRQFKTPESSSGPNARLNVLVEAPVVQGSSIGVQSEVAKKTIGTSTLIHLESNTSQTNDQSYRNAIPFQQQPVQGGCICGSTSYGQPPSVMNQGQQTETVARPQTAPVVRSCCCQSQPASSARTYYASPPILSPDRQVEFELELRKQRPCKLTPYDVHEALKSRNTAYFLQFQEDNSLKTEPEKQETKPAMEVVTVKIPMHEPPAVKPTLSSQKSRKSSTKGKSIRAPSTGGTSQSESQINSMNRNRMSGSESPSDAANLLRNTPGRSHFSVTVTDSSAESIHSPERDSRYSSFQHQSRKPHKSPRPSRREKVLMGSRGKGDISQTIVFGTDESKSPSSTKSAQNKGEQGQSGNSRPPNESVSSYDHHGDDGRSIPTLQEYLERNHPKYLDAAEKRRRCIAEMTYLRRLRQQSRKRLLELEGDNMCARQKQQWRARCASRPRPASKKRAMPKSTKSAFARRYMFLPETQQRLAELKKREEKRTNRLMAEIYTRKLQEKVLRGSATIRSSVSVLSSL